MVDSVRLYAIQVNIPFNILTRFSVSEYLFFIHNQFHSNKIHARANDKNGTYRSSDKTFLEWSPLEKKMHMPVVICNFMRWNFICPFWIRPAVFLLVVLKNSFEIDSFVSKSHFIFKLNQQVDFVFILSLY